MRLSEKIKETREELVRRFPKCFRPKGELKLPLACGIREQIFERAPDLDRGLVAMSIRDYIHGPKYLKVSFEGAPRYSLDGVVVGFVTKNEALFAAVKIKSLEQKWAWRDNRKGKKTNAAASKISTTPIPARNPSRVGSAYDARHSEHQG